MHLYTVRLEEPYLERVFGKEHYLYKSRVGRHYNQGEKRRRIRRLTAGVLFAYAHPNSPHRATSHNRRTLGDIAKILFKFK